MCPLNTQSLLLIYFKNQYLFKEKKLSGVDIGQKVQSCHILFMSKCPQQIPYSLWWLVLIVYFKESRIMLETGLWVELKGVIMIVLIKFRNPTHCGLHLRELSCSKHLLSGFKFAMKCDQWHQFLIALMLTISNRSLKYKLKYFNLCRWFGQDV